MPSFSCHSLTPTDVCNFRFPPKTRERKEGPCSEIIPTPVDASCLVRVFATARYESRRNGAVRRVVWIEYGVLTTATAPHSQDLYTFMCGLDAVFLMSLLCCAVRYIHDAARDRTLDRGLYRTVTANRTRSCRTHARKTSAALPRNEGQFIAYTASLERKFQSYCTDHHPLSRNVPAPPSLNLAIFPNSHPMHSTE